MKYEYAIEHQRLSRRSALKLGAAASAAAVVSEGLLAGPAGATDYDDDDDDDKGRDSRRHRKYTDEMFDIEAAKNGAWVPSRYGPEDQRGTLNELTPRRAARAMRKLNLGRGVRSYQLGEEMFNGFPAFPSDPPRLHDMFLYALGFQAPQDFIDAGGIQAAANAPLGPNELIGFEERFAENFTFQIATQIDGLNHIGIGDLFYNGFTALEMLNPFGTTALGNETMGPITARGVIIDIVGLKEAQGATDTFFEAPNGELVLIDNYRITIEDIEKALYRQRIGKRLGAGDVPILHTGWTHLARSAPDRYLASEPGIYLAEARYFADRKCALVCGDTWGLEVLNNEVVEGAFPVHQELITKNGIRIGESMVTDSAIAEHAYEGVFVATPENVPGATCGSTPPVFLSQPGPKPRRMRPRVKKKDD
ncbi:MAG: cyclase family protein [Actinomycetota bacterium]